jgi:hypothetical protein
MKVLIRSIKMSCEYAASKYTYHPERREVTATIQDERDLKEAVFNLPAIEVDGLIVVGGIYELIFARREA